MVSILAYGDANSESCFKTIETLVYGMVEAAFLMRDDQPFLIPEGLYSDNQVKIIT